MEKINETNRLVVEFASIFGDARHYPLSNTSQVWLVCESTVSNRTLIWKSIDGISDPYSQVGQLCFQWHAIQAEFGERLIDGKRVSAEVYIGAWRKAALQPVSVAQLGGIGFQLRICISKSLPGFMNAMHKASTTDFQALLDSPFMTERTASTLIWSIPMNTLENCRVYCNLKNIWLDKEDYPEPVFERFEVLASPGISSAIAGNSAPRHETFDLFAIEGIAA
jgi:hypothetical protein